MMSNTYSKLLIVMLLLNMQLSFAFEECAEKNNQLLKEGAPVEYECAVPVEIKHKAITIVDGTPKASIEQLLKLRSDIKKLREGINGTGLIICEGKAYTLNQLVIAEREYRINEKNMPACLNDALTKFEEDSNQYLAQARGFKGVMLDVINQWAEQRGRLDSILLQWGSQPVGTEHAQMRKMITSFVLLDRFLGDLTCFLNDFRFTCKKSTKIFQDYWVQFQKNRK